MADPQTVIEGTLKYRDNKKWKPRWCVIRKLSPVADCLHLQLYRDSKDRCKNGPTKASLSLEGFLGMETGFTLDKESNTMALICSEVVVVLAFDSRELLIQWQVKVRANLVEEHQFLVQIAYVPVKSKLACGPARLHLLDYMFCLTAGVPPKLLGIWPLRELRRFGVVDGKFCFEGGSRCGKGEGLHVLLTNQAKDLVQTFDMASRGRLPGKRKVSVRKNASGVDGNTHSSLTGGGSRPCSGTVTGDNEKIETCSSESSTKPLLSSGSDGSDVGKGVRPCHFHYRWPSCIVPCGSATRSELGADDGTRTIARSTIGSHGRTTDGQMLWAVGHCQGCGVHYCRRNTGNDKENTAPAAGDEPAGFTPHWTMDLGIVSPSTDGTTPNVQTRTCSRNRTKASPHDRSSLCSQSSQSSGTSTGSNTSSSSSSSMSEYSVPKNCLEAFYDRPKNIHHQNTPGPNFPYNRLSLTEDKDRLGPIREGGPCTCWKQQKTSDPASHELLLFGGGLLCSCWGRTSMDVDMPSVSSSGSSNASPSTSPKKQMPLVSVPILLPCTCGKVSNNPYLNYAVPRSGAPVKGPKEEAGSSEKKTETTTTKTEEGQEAKIINKVDNSNAPSDEKENNGNTVGGGSSTKPSQPHPSSYYQQPVCSCQRLLLCPGSLLPSFNQTTPTDTARRLAGRNSSEYGSVNPKGTPGPPSGNENSKQRGGSDHNLNCRCRQPPVMCPVAAPDCGCGRVLGMPFLNTIGARVGRKDNANHIYVNLKYLQETAAAALSSQGVPGKLIPYYANLHFLQTLSLYENAEILDVRPSHIIPTPFPDGTIPEDGEKPPETIPKRPKKKIDTPSNNGVYEMMSFNQTEFQSASGGNYLLMQPGTSETRELTIAEGASPSVSSQGSSTDSSAASSSSTTVSGNTVAEGDAVPQSILPLRPFMPVLLPFHDHTCDLKENHDCDPSCGGRKCGSEHCRSSRSNSLGDIKVSLFKRGRSSSTDGRQEGVTPEEMGSCQHATCSTASPKSTPRKHPLLTKLTLRSKEKSFSTDEITPPSSAPSSPDSLFLESIQKYPFHRSADCLQLNEEYRLSEEDLSQDPEVIMSQSMDKSLSRTPVSIKRSSSVPCKTNPNNQQQSQHHSASSTDSGISTHLPTSVGGQGAVFSHFIAYHGSLPRRHSGNAANRHPVPDRKFSTGVGSKTPQEQKSSSDQSKMILISECKQCHQFVTSPDGVLVLDAKSMTSSSSSDMSDYIESLSLCSRSSSGSGSSGCGGVGASEYVRTDDLCSALMKIPTSCTSSLRPRSGKEYHSFDRVLIQDGCPYIPITDCSHLNLPCLKPFTDETGQFNLTEEMVNDNTTNASETSSNNNVINNNNANKTNSPSPGYISSSPGNVDFLSSPEKTSQFTFPKESSKELNYLEVVSVGDSEPTSPIVKQGAVQYAVIDMVATSAARKLSSERAQLRSEGRSPTPTECSPKHTCIDDAGASDKK
ncbi:unnamed protein product [Larinioides sclopetarius]|uniref:Protein chico n=1 Tax=Larinioides sclopetarius TaxID=280406 RepID=A0AAV2BJG1_9ARAC